MFFSWYLRIIHWSSDVSSFMNRLMLDNIQPLSTDSLRDFTGFELFELKRMVTPPVVLEERL